MISKTLDERKIRRSYKVILLFIFSFLPWVWNATKDSLPFIEVNSASVGYYQTNVCDISFVKLLLSSFSNNSLILTTTNVENLACLGKIMGMDNDNGKIAV